MIEPDEAVAFKAFAIEMSRDRTEGLSARQRALMACIVIPAKIQKWMLDVGAVEPLLDSIEKTILAAEGVPISLMMDTSVSSTGTTITINCGSHETKDKLLDILTGAALTTGKRSD